MVEINPVGPQGNSLPVVEVTKDDRPMFVDRFHLFAKDGIADRYGGSFRQIVMFDVLPMDREHWPILSDVERVWLVYRV